MRRFLLLVTLFCAMSGAPTSFSLALQHFAPSAHVAPSYLADGPTYVGCGGSSPTPC